MKTIIQLLVFIIAITVLSCTKIREADIAIENVTVIDVAGATPKHKMTVSINGNQIVKISKKYKTRIAVNVKVVDGTGKFLIPGLWDMHIHPYDEDDIRYKEFMTYFITIGITNVRVMSGYPKLFQWRDEISSGKIIGPRMMIAVPPGVSNMEEGRQFVIKSKSEGADFIKIFDGPTRDMYFAIADEAKKQGIPLVGHVPYSIRAVEASDAGQLSIEHKYTILIPCSESEDDIKTNLKNSEFTTSTRIKLYADIEYNEQKAHEFFNHLIENGTFVCPTQVLWNDVAYRDKVELEGDQRLKFFPSVVKDWFKYLYGNLDEESITDLKKLCSKSQFVVGKMNKAGVKLIAGTDSGAGNAAYVFQGFSLHDELELYVKSGLTPLEAIRTATINAAECAGRLDSLGTIEEGKIADLVLLDENPLSSIENTLKINSVFYNGKYYDRSTLDKMMDTLEKLSGEISREYRDSKDNPE